ncbi:MAG: flagellar biosynthesis protein FlhB [Lachnospiraceae bacterium]|nr:flagellar biosynthesis protein FlhB [Lachnospiraceae bacterium]
MNNKYSVESKCSTDDSYRIFKLNLQLFAKDGPGGEKTEPATQRKLDEARKEGQVAKSKEIINAAFLVITFYMLQFTIGNIGNSLMEVFNGMYSLIPNYKDRESITISTATAVFEEAIWSFLSIIAPFLIVCVFIGFIGNVVQVKWKPTAKPITPKFNKISPLSGFKRIFSLQSIVNLLKSVAIVIICLYIVYTELMDNFNGILNIYEISLEAGIILSGELVFGVAAKISLLYLVVGIVDLIYQRRKFNEDMKMTKQEVKEEYKNTEGDPTIKQQQRRRMREASQRRMMQKLPEADVVITNPTHYAVAIKYDLDIADAPVVLAKGEDYLAMKIKEVARENDIEIVENKPLARAIYSSVDVGEKIPQELYQAVAEVLAYVYGVKNKDIPLNK